MNRRLPDPAPEGERARILSERVLPVSPWVRLVERDVLFPHAGEPQLWHLVGEADGCCALPILPDGRIALVGQFRPATGGYHWELPAGMVEPDEAPEVAMRRELLEETGLTARTLTCYGAYSPDVARLAYQAHMFLAMTDPPNPDFIPEPGTKVAFVTRDELFAIIRAGGFQSLNQMALFAMAWLIHAPEPGLRPIG